MPANAAPSAFPVVKQSSRTISGFPTEILLQIFDDKTLILVTQGKVGRMIQVSPPSTSSRRRQRDMYRDAEQDDEDEDSPQQQQPASSLSDTFLPPPDPSSALSTLFGSSKSESMSTLEQLYASQIAAILFASTLPASTNSGADGDDAPPVILQGKPAVVALGLKPSFLESEAIDDSRSRFKEVTQLVGDALKA